ncbi:Pentatricopeptide repeat-containing protein At3g49240, mitochondrial [Linum grandiflorum]
MALSKPAFFARYRALSNPLYHNYHRSNPLLPPPPPIVAVRFLSFSTPEEAEAERRRRKRRLRIEPPLSSAHRAQQQQQQQIPKPKQNPNEFKLPEPISALSGNRLNLHNRILTLIRENDLDEAALFTRHSVYSNCRPTIYTVNAVLNAQFRQSKYADLLSLRRFIIQAGVAPNVITHNLVFQTYLTCRKPDTAMEIYKQLMNDAPVGPSPTTYRILIDGLVNNGMVDRALQLKEEMVETRAFSPDPLIYHYLMNGCVKNNDADAVFSLYEELKEKMGGFVSDGVVYGGLMKGYFMRGMEKEAMECYEEAVGENSKVKMTALAYNSVLEALCKNSKFDEALSLFDRVIQKHNPPRDLAVNLGSFNVMVDGYCSNGRFKDAIDVFRRMGDYRCSPDTLSFNNLMDQLCGNGMLVDAEEVYGDMDGKQVKPDEYTFGLLMDACFKEGRIDDGAAYFRKMVDSGLRPDLAVYDRLVGTLVQAGKLDEAKSFYELMVKKLKMNDESYKFIMKALSDAGRLDEVLELVDAMLDDEAIDLTEELQEFVKGDLLSKEGREDELTKLMDEKTRQKAEAKAKEIEEAEATKKRAKVAIASLFPPKLIGNKENETGSAENNDDAAAADVAGAEDPVVEEATVVGSVSGDAESRDEQQRA